MTLRIIGVCVAVLGVALAVLGAIAVHQSSDRAMQLLTASLQTGDKFSPCDWEAHWRISSATIACAGAAFALGGAAVALRKRWGLLVLGCTTALLGTLPWILKLAGMDKYAFEKPGIAETLVLFGLATCALYGYMSARRMRPNGSIKSET